MNIDERLIRRIIIETLEKADAETQVAKEAEETESAPSVAVALSASASAKAADEAARLLLKNGCSVAAVGCAHRAPEALYEAVRKHGLEALCGCEPRPLPPDIQAVAAPMLSLGDAAKLAGCILDDLPAEWIWTALSNGAAVFASPGFGFGGEAGSSTGRAAEEIRLACERLGVQWTAPGEIHLAASAELNAAGGGATLHVPNSSSRPLIAEATIENLRSAVQTIVVPSNAVITPLARDLAKQRGIVLQMRS